MMLGGALRPANHGTYITHGLSISPENEAAIHRAIRFATCAHRHQKRKYTGEPYINHCIAVARLVVASGGDVITIIAAILHDTIEDTEVSFEDVLNRFGAPVARLVMEVSSPGTLEDCLRDVRHQINLAHLKNTSSQGATIKIADIIDNTNTIQERDAVFAITYLPEKWEALDMLRHGNPDLHARAIAQVSSNLHAAKNAAYPIPPGPYRSQNYILPPTEYEKAIFAVMSVREGCHFSITWRDGVWQHSNVELARIVRGAPLSSKQIEEAGIPTC